MRTAAFQVVILAAGIYAFKTFIPIFWQASYGHGITVWGWIVGRTRNTNSGIVNGTSPRAAMTWLMGYLNRPVPPN